MSKAYSKGYEQGYEDACRGRSKHVNLSALWAEMKQAFSLTGNLDQFMEGYDEGYRIGSRDRARGECS